MPAMVVRFLRALWPPHSVHLLLYLVRIMERTLGALK